MEDSVRERLRMYIAHTGLSERQFCVKVGVSTSFVANISRSIQPDKVGRISKQFPDLNTGWLLTGEGEMLKSGTIQQAGDNSTQVHGNDNHVNNPHVLEMAMQEIAEQRKLVAKSQEQIDRLITLLERAK